jgi:hypothetical protein
VAAPVYIPVFLDPEIKMSQIHTRIP